MRLFRTVSLIFIGGFFYIQSSLADEYQIELLVFEHLASMPYDEIWEASLVDTPESGTRNVQWVDSSNLTLNEEHARLKGARDYRPLLHTAWIEDVSDKNTARSVRLTESAKQSSTGEKLSGTARVYIGRYLHLELDLFLPVGEAAMFDDIIIPTTSNRYHLNESRRMRSKKIHYFDDPHIGVLAVITPVEYCTENQRKSIPACLEESE